MSDIHDVLAPIAKPLTPANQNPWYVLMTLYGEPSGEDDQFDWELHRKNARAWNTWVLSKLNEAEQHEVRNIFSWLETLPEEAVETKLEEVLTKFDEKSKELGFSRLVLNELFPVSFENTYFPNAFVLHDMLIMTEVHFVNCVFESSIEFSGSFNKAVCIEKCNLKSGLSFSDSKFRELNIFDCSVVGNAYISGSTFLEGINIAGSVFRRQVNLSRSEFCGRTLLHRATFEEGADFRYAEFCDAAGRGPIFELTRFDGPTSFWKSRFSSAYPELDSAILHAETTFYAEPGDTDGPFWPEKPIDPKASKDSCAKIRNNIGKQGFPEAEHFFYRKEMRFTGMAAENPFEKLVYWMFGTLSDYGYSFVRPVVALAAIFGLGLAAHWGFFLQSAASGALGKAFGLSFSNVFPYFGLSRFFDPGLAVGLPPVLKALSGFQTVSGAILLFLFALGLRTRFRMR